MSSKTNWSKSQQKGKLVWHNAREEKKCVGGGVLSQLYLFLKVAVKNSSILSLKVGVFM